MTVVRHETAHQFDRTLDDRLETLKDTILGRCASDDDFLRVTVGNTYFQSAPQEIIASHVGNQYAVSSSSQFAVALVRADGGNFLPLAWFLLNVEIFAGDADASLFYEDDVAADGRADARAVSLARASDGAVEAMRLPGCGIYAFAYDDDGVVESYSGPDDGCTEPTADITAEPSRAPTAQVDGGCADSTSWYYKKKSKKDCAWVAKKGKRCKSKVADEDDVSSLDACPVTCGSGCACADSADSTSWYYKKKSKKDCEWVAEKTKRCKWKVADDAGISSSLACPVACSSCGP